MSDEEIIRALGEFFGGPPEGGRGQRDRLYAAEQAGYLTPESLCRALDITWDRRDAP